MWGINLSIFNDVEHRRRCSFVDCQGKEETTVIQISIEVDFSEEITHPGKCIALRDEMIASRLWFREPKVGTASFFLTQPDFYLIPKPFFITVTGPTKRHNRNSYQIKSRARIETDPFFGVWKFAMAPKTNTYSTAFSLLISLLFINYI